MIQNGKNFTDNLVQEEIADTTEEEFDVDEEFNIYLPSPKIKSYREAIQSFEDSQIFFR